MKLSIKEIETKLINDNEVCEQFIRELKIDERKGVQRALLRWEADQAKKSQLLHQFEEMLAYEHNLRQQGCQLIAGIDEVGRGPLAGPVVAAAVILPENFQLLGLTDSKKVPLHKREIFFEYIFAEALSIGIGVVTAAEIDEINIYEASKLAMLKAINCLTLAPDHLLIDAMRLPSNINQTAIIKGDSKSISIAASSIVAKVTRDRYMKKLAEKYPQYGFESHMGYGTKEHLTALDQHGITLEHRRTFAPVRERC